LAKLLWKPSPERIANANMTRFIGFVNKKQNLEIRSYNELYTWSVENLPDFWASVWDFVSIKASRGYERVVDDLEKFPGAKWFVGSKLNFAENLLKFRDDREAFVFRGENQKTAKTTYAKLHRSVARLAEALRDMKINPGDRIAAYMPNIIETATAMLATTSIGAVWSSCGVELGPKAVVDRLSQIGPKVLFTVDGYSYKGKTFSVLNSVREIAQGVPSLQKTVVLPYAESKPDLSQIPNAIDYREFGSEESELRFEQLPFDHPVYIMFSSGTTGKPKCMVQGAGSILINHLKELILHTDLRREDKIFYITSPSWMMWNWLMSSLAVGATIVLYDGNPSYPDWNVLWKLVQEERITIFGCSASYINYLKSVGATPGTLYDLSSLREMSQTGSPLSAEGFEYAYQEIKKDLHFNSISGGTDINGCFAIGSPIQPVYEGELQGPGLGMKVKAYDDRGNPVVDRQGELVCEAPAPSMPLYFWNDPDNEKYKDAYFRFYPNKNVWRHGDYIMIHSGTGGLTFFGRSDSVLKPSGVRIGTAEIYNIVEKMEEIADSLAIGQNWKDDQRIILFVKLEQGYQLTEELKNKIRRTLRVEASPRHVPALIIETPDIPYTFNMKKVESAVTNIVHGKHVSNRESLTNPKSLDFFEEILPELQKDA
jgi:acetoacetyl-CoA synthetase